MENTCESKPKTFKEYIKSRNFKRSVLGAVIGGSLGFAYYYFIGCSSGTCAITSNPYNSVIYGSLMGLLVTNSPCSTC